MAKTCFSHPKQRYARGESMPIYRVLIAKTRFNKLHEQENQERSGRGWLLGDRLPPTRAMVEEFGANELEDVNNATTAEDSNGDSSSISAGTPRYREVEAPREWLPMDAPRSVAPPLSAARISDTLDRWERFECPEEKPVEEDETEPPITTISKSTKDSFGIEPNTKAYFSIDYSAVRHKISPSFLNVVLLS
ncbi:hypothetical protein FQN51_005307 [Onygenales sp. PD_10]|nr:hypothetical protein FQN51_005307 [Onygenales sp. PD_10]